MTFKNIEFGSDDYRKECELRNAVLRLPIGLNLAEEDLSVEEDQSHFGLFDHDQNLIATVIAVSLSLTEAKIRQMAVRTDRQKQGHGQQLIRELEKHLSASGVLLVFLHARVNAIPFYEKFGYVVTGGEFTEVNLPHFKMTKNLAPGCPGERVKL